MNFFTELLESFSRKHDRKLRLLEQKTSRQEAEQAVTSFITGAANKSFNDYYKDPQFPTVGSYNKKNKKGEFTNEVIGASVTKDGRLNSGTSVDLGTTEGREKFINRLMNDPKGESPEQNKELLQQQKEDEERQLRRKKVLNSVMAQNEPEVVAEIVKNVEEFENIVTDLLCGEGNTINPDFKSAIRADISDADSWNYCGTHLAFFRGERAGNVEQQLVNETPTLRYDGKEGEYIIGSKESDADASEAVSKALVTLAKAATGNEDAKEEACKLFQVTQGGGLNAVTVYTEYSDGRGQRGRVFNNEASARSLKGLMSLAGCDTTPQSARRAVIAGSVGAESNIRGTMGEIAKVAVTNIANLSTLKRSDQGIENDRTKTARELALDGLKTVYKQLDSLSEERETWIEKSQSALATEEEQAAIEMLSEISEDKEKIERFVKAIFSMASTTFKQRKPKFAIQVADEIGGGQKQDVLECWDTPEKAFEALKKSEGYKDDEGEKTRITLDDVKDSGKTAAEIFGEKRKQLLQKYIKAGFIESEDQVFYSAEISLKTLLSLSAAKQGETTPKSVSKSILQGEDPRFRNIVSDIEKLSDGSSLVEGIQRQQRESDRLLKSVQSLTTRVKVKDTVTNPLKTYAEGLLDSIRKNNSYESLGQSDYEDLSNYIQEMSNEYKLGSPSFVKKVQQKLFKMTLFTRLNTAAQAVKVNGRPTKRAKEAMLYSLTVLNQAGGSAKDDTIFQVDVLDQLTSYVSTQNGEINSVLQSLLNDEDRWDFQGSTGSLTFSYKGDDNNPSNRNRTISVTYKDGKWIAYRSATSIRDASTATKSKDLVENSNTEIYEALGKLQEALGIIQKKVRILDAK
tara:strand:- start:3753 stop:6320 length:2568 start_codon:yes stop_codon:yes gene_type:complete